MGMRFALEFPDEFRSFPDKKLYGDDFDRRVLGLEDPMQIIKSTSKYLSTNIPDEIMFYVIQCLYLAVNPPAAYKDPGDELPFVEGDAQLLLDVFRELRVPQDKAMVAVKHCPENFIGTF